MIQQILTSGGMIAGFVIIALVGVAALVMILLMLKSMKKATKQQQTATVAADELELIPLSVDGEEETAEIAESSEAYPAETEGEPVPEEAAAEPVYGETEQQPEEVIYADNAQPAEEAVEAPAEEVSEAPVEEAAAEPEPEVVEEVKPKKGKKAKKAEVVEEVVEEAATEAKATETVVAEAAVTETEEAADENSVHFGESKTITEQYEELSREQKSFFDELKETALTKPYAEMHVTKSYVTIKIEKQQLMKIVIKRGVTIAQFLLENEALKQYRQSNKNKRGKSNVKVKPTSVQVVDLYSLRAALDMIDLAYNELIEKDN